MKITHQNIDSIMDDILSGKKIPTLNDFTKSGFSKFAFSNFIMPDFNFLAKRYEFVEKYSFALPCKEAIDLIKNYGKIVELGAGTGFWTAMLQKRGFDIIATNFNENSEENTEVNSYGHKIGTYINMENIDGEQAVEKYSDRNILAVWPCYGSDWIERVARKMNKNQKLILIHEGRGGCIGNEGFYEYALDNLVPIQNQEIPNWPGIHDYITVFGKNENDS